ncbi:MAG: hypothetical protein ABSB19_08225 [Methylomonas sp.]
MKLKLLSAAVSAISLAGFAQTSSATAYDLYLAGSSAQDNLVLQEVANLCLSGFTLYEDNANQPNGTNNTGNWGSNYKVYTCTVNPAKVTTGTLAAGDVVTFHKVNFGGSAQGVAPLFQGVAVPTLNINNSNCYQIAGFSAKLPNGTAVTTYGCTTTNSGDMITTALLDAGLSDLNPTAFQGVNTAEYISGGVIKSFNPVTKVPAGFTVESGVSLVWGFPVNTSLYTALQAAEGLLSYSGTYGTGTCTAGQYSSATAVDGCMPSLVKSQITSLVSGGVTDWSTFNVVNPSTGVIVSLTAAAADYDAHLPSGATSIAPADTLVNFCQRLPGSGTAAGQYGYFLNQPANDVTSLVNPATNAVENVYQVPDSGNMEKCLDDLAKGTSNGQDIFGKPLTGPTSQNGEPVGYVGWAFGQQSTDKNVTLGKAYRFIKINGQAPTLANAFSGTYDYTSESTWQFPTSSSRTVESLIVKQLILNAQSPYAIYGDLGQYSNQPFGNAGFWGTVANALNPSILGGSASYTNPINMPSAATSAAAYTANTTAASSYPVNPWTHAVTGGILDDGAFQTLNTNPTTTVAP